MALKLTAEVIALGAEPGLSWVRKELSHWPLQSCWDTCASIIDCLHQNLPTWKFSIIEGYWTADVVSEDYRSHVWLGGKLRGRQHFGDELVIVDPTAGQFLIGEAIQVFYQGEPDYWRYLPGIRLRRLEQDGV